MRMFRHLITVSTGVLIALIYGASANSQALAPLDEAPNNQPTVSEPKNETVAPSSSPQVLQPTSSMQDKTAPAYLNPSANPLLFPTKPEEVEIKKSQPITLEQAIELALKNNKDLQNARIALDKSRAKLQAALAAEYPSLDFQTELSRDHSAAAVRQNQLARQSGLPASQQETTTNLNGQLELSYDVYTGGRRSATIDQSEREVRLNELEVERTSEQTRFDTTDNYYRLQDADAQVAIEQAAVDDANQTLRDAQLLERAGLGTKFDVLRAEVRLAEASQRLTQAIANQRTARQQLAETLSIGQKVELMAADEIQQAGNWGLSLEDSIVQAYKNRAELEQQLVQKEIAEQQANIELAAIKPQVSLFANYNFLDNFDDSADIASGYSFGTRLRWRLFDGGRAVAQAQQSYRDMDTADTNFAQQRNNIRFEVERAYYNLISNKDNIQSTRRNVELANEALRLARLRFQAGVGTQTDVIDAQSDLTTARSNYLRAIIGYNQSLNSLQRQVSNLPDNRLFELR